jgi:RND superfamily putative drug exporter
MVRMFSVLGRFAATYPLRVCAIWLTAGGLLSLLAPTWDSKAQDDDIHFLPARYPSVRGYDLLARAFPRDVFASRAVFAFERQDRKLDENDFSLVDQCVVDLKKLRDGAPEFQLGDILSCHDGPIGSRLTSVDGRCTLIQVSFGTPFQAAQTRAAVTEVDRVVRTAALGPDVPRVFATGAAAIGRDLHNASADSLEATTLATIALVVVVLLFVYRAPLLALIPLLTIAVSVWIALKALALLTLIPGVYLVNISRIFTVVILYGAGTDYCLFLISRYCEELDEGRDGPDAVRRSVTGVGGALLASAGTVICGLGLMGFAEFAKVRSTGPAIALGLVVAVLAALTLSPALLQLLGSKVFWPRQRGRGCSSAAGPQNSGFWERVSRRVVARPAEVLGAALIVLGPFVVLGWRVHPVHRLAGELSPAANSVQGLAAVKRHFPAGEAGPLTVLLTAGRSWETAEGRHILDHLSRGFGNLPNVVEVRSLTQPLGKRLPQVATPLGKPARTGLVRSLTNDTMRKALEQAQRAARTFYLADLQEEGGCRYVTRLDVVLGTDPLETASLRTVELIQTWLSTQMPATTAALGRVHSECYGATVNVADLADVAEADRVRVDSLVLVGVFLILLLVVRRPWLAAYLLLTVLLSYYATLGATALLNGLWLGRRYHEVDWRVPFFLFAILVAVGEDYNILLVTRIFKERKRFGVEEGIRRALARTGGTITSCGLIMAGTFATLMLAGLGTLKQIGFALAFGVLLDTFVVRPILVPAFMLLVWRLGARSAASPESGHEQHRAA